MVSFCGKCKKDKLVKEIITSKMKRVGESRVMIGIR